MRPAQHFLVSTKVPCSSPSSAQPELCGSRQKGLQLGLHGGFYEKGKLKKLTVVCKRKQYSEEKHWKTTSIGANFPFKSEPDNLKASIKVPFI